MLTLAVILPAGGLGGFSSQQATPPSPAVPGIMSGKQLRTLLKGAHTAEDHESLAHYFRAREAAHRAEEVNELKLLNEYRKGPPMYPVKYPTRGDSLRHLASYHHSEAEKFAGRAFQQQLKAAALRTNQ